MKYDTVGYLNKGKGVILSPCLLLLFLVLIAILVSVSPIRSFDVWWHLAAGKWMFQHHRISSIEPFSFLHSGEEWIDCSWLFQVWIYWLYSIGGYAALIIWKLVIVLSIFFVMYLICGDVLKYSFVGDEFSVDENPFKLAYTLAFIFSMTYFSRAVISRVLVRPHLLSYLFSVWTLYVMLSFDRHPRLIYSLFPMAVLWVNVHGSFPILVFIVSCFSLHYFWSRDFKRFLYINFVSLLLLLAFLVNPFFYKVWNLVFSHMHSGDALFFIKEWKGVSLWSLFNLSHNALGKVSFFIFCFGVIFYAFNWKRPFVIVLAAAFFYMLIRHHRFYPLWIIVSFPFAMVSITYILDSHRLLGVLFGILSLALFVSLCSRVDMKDVGYGVKRGIYPEGIATFIRKVGLKGRIFNPYAYGGYLIWKLYPDVKVFIDGRTPTIYSSDDFFLYRMAIENPYVLERLVNRYHIDLVLLRRRFKLYNFLLKNKDWNLIAFDQVGVLFVRRKTLGGKLEEYSLGNLDIDSLSVKESSLKDPVVLYNKLLVLNNIYPRCGDYKIFLGICSYAMGNISAAKKWFKEALKVDIDKVDAYYNLGIVALKLGKLSEAAKYLDESMKHGDNSDATIFLAAKCYFALGEYRKAAKLFDIYINKMGLSANKDAYWYSGLALYRLGRLRKALSRFRRFSFLVDNPAAAYYNMGNCYFGLGELKKAINCYLKALNWRRRYTDAAYNLWKTYQVLGDTKDAVKYKRLYERFKNDRQ